MDNKIYSKLSQFLAITKLAKPKFSYHKFKDGVVINADSTDPKTFQFTQKYLKGERIQLIHSDPPYNIAIDNLEWDKFDMNQQEFADWMKSVIKLYYPLNDLQKFAHLFKNSTQSAKQSYPDLGIEEFQEYNDWLKPTQEEKEEDQVLSSGEHLRWSHKSNEQLKELIQKLYLRELQYAWRTPQDEWPQDKQQYAQQQKDKARAYFEFDKPINVDVKQTQMGYQVIVNGEIIAMGKTERDALMKATAMLW